MFKRIVFILIAGLLAAPSLSLADRGVRDGRESPHFYRYHEHPRWGLHVSVIPDTYFSVNLGRSRFYYYDGIYYNRAGAEYVIVAPPVGAVVNAVPSEFTSIVVNGVTYYTDQTTYYVYTRYGYQVVPPPVVYQAPVVVTQPAPTPVITQPAPVAPVQINAGPAPSDDPDAFTVNIPNDKGGYTPVTLKKSGTGYMGPQGEFYQDFPKVAQLKVMYGK